VAILALAALAIVAVAAANDGRALRRRRHAP
jgi:hypothetical protein